MSKGVNCTSVNSFLTQILTLQITIVVVDELMVSTFIFGCKEYQCELCTAAD